MKIRPAEPVEAQPLSELAQRSKAYWGYSSEFMAACRDELTYTPEQIAAGGFWVAQTDNGELVGFYALLKVSPTALELEAMFVEPERLGKGCGRALMEHAVRQAGGTEHIERLIIQADPNAAGFYEQAGATCIGERPSASIDGRLLPLYEIALPRQPADVSNNP